MYKKESLGAVRETRHTQFMSALLNVAAKMPAPGVDHTVDLFILDDHQFNVTTYYGQWDDAGKFVTHQITHRVTVTTDTTVEK